MTMQKRHFEAIAETMQQVAVEVEKSARLSGGTANYQDFLHIMRAHFADLGARSNPQFKRERFVAATLPGANVRARS
jgi:hypothetical protein